MPSLFEPAHTEQVKTWLTSELGPICDAEPDVLADYVIALLKHDTSPDDLAALLNEQLSDFLDDKTSHFVDKLINTISTQAYISKPTATAPDEGQSSRKRAAEDDERPEASSKAARTAGDNGGGPPRQPAADRTNGMGGAGSSNGRERDARERDGSTAQDNGQGPHGHAQQNRPKAMCRDFHEKGWCGRGEKCKYEHSTHAIRGSMPFMGHHPNAGMGHQMNMGRGMPGQVPPPGFMPHGQMDGFQMQSPMQMPGWGQPPNGNFPHQPQFGPGGSPPQSLAARLGEQAGSAAPPTSDDFSSASSSDGGHRGGFAGRGRGRGGGPAGTFQSRARSTTTLVIENVPADSLDLVRINDYFRRFGTITNIQIDAGASKALVSYASPAEAKAAHESPDVIFGNRFVKVYFQKLDTGPEARPAPTSKPHFAAAPKQTFNPGQNVYRAPGAAAIAAPSPAQGPSPEQLAERKNAIEAQKIAQNELNELMTEQKQLLLKVGSGSASPDEKKAGMKRLRELEPTIKEATEKVKAAVNAVTTLPSLPAASAASTFDAGKKQEQREKAEKERLDRELEAHSKSNVPGSQTEELRAKLASLKAEAASLGLNQDGGAEGSSRGAYRGGRGGRGSYRGGPGRGGWSGGGAMRLDNRPSRLSVSNIPQDADVQAVKDWLQGFGEVVSFEPADSKGPEISVTFKHRSSGEQAVRSGGEIPNVGKLSLAWTAGPAASAPEATTGEASSAPSASTAPTAEASNAPPGSAAAGEAGEDDWKRGES